MTSFMDVPVVLIVELKLAFKSLEQMSELQTRIKEAVEAGRKSSLSTRSGHGWNQ